MKTNQFLKAINMKKVIIIFVLFLSTQVFTSCVKEDLSEPINMEQQIKADDGDWNGGAVDDGSSDSDND
jgi:hypothetical protein